MARTPKRGQSHAAGLNRAGQWWLAAGALVVGVIVGAVAVGLLSEGSPSPGQLQAGPETSTAGPGSSSAGAPATASGATAEVIVNDACLRAITDAQTALDTFQGIGDAARTFNAAQLDAIIRQLQPLRARLIDDINACEVTTKLPSGVTVASSLSGSSAATPTTSETTDSIGPTTAPTTR